MATVKRAEGVQHPDRNAQFESINALAKGFLAAGLPVVSVEQAQADPVRRV